MFVFGCDVMWRGYVCIICSADKLIECWDLFLWGSQDWYFVWMYRVTQIEDRIAGNKKITFWSYLFKFQDSKYLHLTGQCLRCNFPSKCNPFTRLTITNTINQTRKQVQQPTTSLLFIPKQPITIHRCKITNHPTARTNQHQLIHVQRTCIASGLFQERVLVHTMHLTIKIKANFWRFVDPVTYVYDVT